MTHGPHDPSASPVRRAPLVLVRCDVGPRQGIGHVMRTLAVAEELGSRGYRVHYSADLASVPFAREQVEARGLEWSSPTEDLAAEADRLRPVAVVLDSYTLPGTTYAALRARTPTMAMVDGAPGEVEADLLVDQNIGAELDTWPLPDGAARLAGLGYALMRDEVLAARRDPSDGDGDGAGAARVLAFFGGTDAFGAAPVLTRALIGTGRPMRLRVVAAGVAVRDDLAALVPGPGQHVEVMDPTPAIAAEVAAADLVVSAAGSSAWELLCQGTACALVCVVDNQELAYERLRGTGVVALAGRLARLRADVGPAVEVLGPLLDDRDRRRELRRRAAELVDGRGRVRVVDALLAVAARRLGASRLV